METGKWRRPCADRGPSAYPYRRRQSAVFQRGRVGQRPTVTPAGYANARFAVAQIAQDSNRGPAPLAIRCTSDKTCWGRSHSMELGIYHEFPVLPGRSQAECFAAGFDIVDAGEEYGLDVIWLAELHFDKRRALAASPLVRGPRSRPAPKGLGSGPA